MPSTTAIRLARAWRPMLVFAAGAVLGATLLTPVAAQVGRGAAAPAATFTRSASCAGLNFQALDGDTASFFDGSLRYRAGNSSEGSGFFVCDPGLPNGAIVEAVEFTVRDTSHFGRVRFCGLDRNGLTPSTAGSVKTLASVPDTELDANPGIKRLTDHSISFATIDNTRYAYWLQCYLDPEGTNTGIYGADVVYRIGGVNA